MKNTAWLKQSGVPYAHRGLHDNITVPENSLLAIRRAVESGYGIELDVYLTLDGNLIVHHDPTLRRTCGMDIPAEQVVTSELNRYPLMKTSQRIPLLREVLDVVDGAVDLIVEIKTTRRVDATCQAVYEMMKDYRGHYAIESFQPSIVRWWAFRHPEIVLGQLYSPRYLVRKLTGAMRTQRYVDFFAIAVSDVRAPFAERLRRLYPEKAFVTWTVRTPQQQRSALQTCDAYIFECDLKNPSYIPLPELTK